MIKLRKTSFSGVFLFVGLLKFVNFALVFKSLILKNIPLHYETDSQIPLERSNKTLQIL